MLEGACTFQEAISNVIRLPNMRPEVYEQVVLYSIKEWHLNQQCQRAERIVFGVEVEEESIMELALACHYLVLPGLLKTACRMLSFNLER